MIFAFLSLILASAQAHNSESSPGLTREPDTAYKTCKIILHTEVVMLATFLIKLYAANYLALPNRQTKCRCDQQRPFLLEEA